MTNSSQKQRHQILGVISADRAERLLVDWANLSLGDPQTWARLFVRYPEIAFADVAQLAESLKQKNVAKFGEHGTMAAQMAGIIRKAWDAPDLRHFDWYTWKAQDWYHTLSVLYGSGVSSRPMVTDKDAKEEAERILSGYKATREPPAVPSAVEAAIFHLRNNRARALHCPNPGCPAPYFFASKKGQKYCSEECAKPAQRAAKRQWWAEHRAKGARHAKRHNR